MAMNMITSGYGTTHSNVYSSIFVSGDGHGFWNNEKYGVAMLLSGV